MASFQSGKVNSQADIAIRKSAVPLYLQNGDLYRSLNDDDDEITVPFIAMKADATITNEHDMLSLLSSLRFWLANEIPRELILFCMSREVGFCESIIEEFTAQLVYLQTLRALCGLNASEQLKVVIESQNLELLRFLHSLEWDLKECWRDALDTGNAAVLQFVHEHGGELGEEAFQRAVRTGKLECVKYMHECGVTKTLWPNPFTMSAAANGHVGVLRYLHEQGFPWDQFVQLTAAQNGHLECVKYTVEHGCPRYRGCVNAAAETGKLDLVQYLYSQGYEGNEDACQLAVQRGHLHCLIYLHENDCPWDVHTTIAAAGNRIDCLKYAHQHGCPWNSNAMIRAIAADSVECLQYLHENGCFYDKPALKNATDRFPKQSPKCHAYIYEHML